MDKDDERLDGVLQCFWYGFNYSIFPPSEKKKIRSKMDFGAGSLGGGGGSPGPGGQLSGAQKEMLMEQIKQQVAVAVRHGRI